MGEIPASNGASAAPTVLAYGHFDVQPPAPLELWETDPFEATIRDEWLYARGVADDKGQLWMLVHAAGMLAAEGALPINLRIVSDGEEEVGGQSIVEFLQADERGADCCVIFDGGMERRELPALSVATRGLAAFNLRVQTGERDLHSGMYGNAAMNAIHALLETLGGILPRDGRVPEALRIGIDPSRRGARCLGAAAGGRRGAPRRRGGPLRPRGGRGVLPPHHGRALGRGERDPRRQARPEEHDRRQRGAGELHRPARARPGSQKVAPEVERLLHEAAPEGATVEVEELEGATRPGLVDAGSPT